MAGDQTVAAIAALSVVLETMLPPAPPSVAQVVRDFVTTLSCRQKFRDSAESELENQSPTVASETQQPLMLTLTEGR
jgi:hypothetical protein